MECENPKRDQTDQFRVCFFFDVGFMKKTGRSKSDRE